VLGDPPSRLADLLTVRGVDLRLYRRIIEIRDAQWELGLAAPASAAASAGASAPADATLDEQARLLLREGRVVATPEVTPPGHNDPPGGPPALNVS
jgi:hypothetical protein